MAVVLTARDDMRSLQLDVHLEEYRTLRSEIGQRIHHQVLILGASVALIGAAVPAVPTIVANEQPIVLLVGALAFVVLGWLYFEQDLLLFTAAWYVEFGLRPAILEVLGEEERRASEEVVRSPALGWERSKWANTSHLSMRRPLPLFRAAATIGPALMLCLGAVLLRIELGRAANDWIAGGETLLFFLIVAGAVDVARLQITLQARKYPQLSGVTNAPPKTATPTC